MTVNINTNLDLNITDFLLLQEISEMKLNRNLDELGQIKFYDLYKNNSININLLKEYFYATIGSTQYLNPDNGKIEYIGGAGKYTKISKTQADYFLDNFKIKDYYGNDNTGFSATVFAKNGDTNGDTNEITISFRSTEFGEDYYKDAYGADCEISYYGTAIAQNIAMLNYINKLRLDGIITTNTKINLTGYSLGGHLASSTYQYLH